MFRREAVLLKPSVPAMAPDSVSNDTLVGSTAVIVRASCSGVSAQMRVGGRAQLPVAPGVVPGLVPGVPGVVPGPEPPPGLPGVLMPPPGCCPGLPGPLPVGGVAPGPLPPFPSIEPLQPASARARIRSGQGRARHTSSDGDGERGSVAWA